MQRFKIKVVPDHPDMIAPGESIYIDGEISGERWCEVLGGVGVDREKRARIIANALYVYQNHIYPKTTPKSKLVAGFPQMELQFPEE